MEGYEMQFDSFEKLDVKISETDTAKRLSNLHKGFESSMSASYGNYYLINESSQESLAAWIGENSALNSLIMPDAINAIKEMYKGKNTYDIHTLGLEEIHSWKIPKEYKHQCTKQHAGYAAEIISTAKENLLAKLKGTGLETVRADDRPDLYPKNDQYVDKIRIDSAGNVVERVQTKFVGKNPAACLEKLKSKKFEKYFMEDKVDKVEIPKDFYKGVKALLNEQIKGLEKEIEYLKKDGNEKALSTKKELLDKLRKIDQKVEQSTVTNREAVFAVKHPDLYKKVLFTKEFNRAGIESGLGAAGLTTAVSTVDNIHKYMNGEITATEAVLDIGKDAGVAGGVGYATGFVTSAVATTMSGSSHALIQKVGGSCAPAAVVAWGVQSFDAVVDYAQGEITPNELAYNLGENAASVAGGIAGGAAGSVVGAVAGAKAGAVVGAAVGSIIPGAGTAVGAGVGATVGAGAGLVGSMVGCAIASEAYATAVELGGEGAEVMAAKAQEMASKTVEIAKAEVPEKVGFIRESINTFASENNIPIKV